MHFKPFSFEFQDPTLSQISFIVNLDKVVLMSTSPANRKRGYAHQKLTSEEASIKWTLDNFLAWAESKPAGFILDSPIFSFEIGNDTLNFFLKLHPKGKARGAEAEDNENEMFGLFLYSKNPGTITSEVSFKFLTKEKKVLRQNKFVRTFDGSGKGYGFEALPKKTLQEGGLLPDDPLNIQCTISVQICESSDATYDTIPPPEKRSKTVLVDFAQMYEDQAFSDFEIVCQEKSFPCHKNVLAARSEVFKKMLNTVDGEEAKKNCLVIKDFENEQVGQLLQFIYSGSLKEEDYIGTELLLLADKYDLPDLVHICEVALARDVSHEYPMEASLGILDIANRISSEYLIKVCSTFVAKNLVKLMTTPEWTRIVKENPGALISVFKEIPEL